MEGLVYFLKADFSDINEDLSFHRVKVGKAKKLKPRKDALLTGSPVDLISIRTIEHSKYSKYEKYVHCAFKFHRVKDKNEWFDLPDDIFYCIKSGTEKELEELFENLCGLSFEEYCRIIHLGY